MAAVATTGNLEQALAILRRGWVPIPLCWPDEEGRCACGRGHEGHDIGKAPLLGQGWETARPSEQNVRQWWARWPRANVGLLLAPSGLLFVGPDDEGGRAFAQAHGRPGTVCRISANPGYVYRRPAGCPIASTKLKTAELEIDVKANGYCVAYGRHKDGPAIYLEGEDLAEAPAWAVEMFQKAPGRPAADGGDDEPPVRLDANGLALWRGEVAVDKDGVLKRAEDCAQVDRSVTLFRIGLDLAKAGASRRTIIDALAERDTALGYDKYAERRDGGAGDYATIADKALAPPEEGPPLSLPTASGRTDAPASPANDAPWPEPLAAAAYHGLAGDIVQALAPHTEADPAALLVQLLAAFGSAVGHGPYFEVEATPHHGNLFAVLVGATAKGRKGTSWEHVLRLVGQADLLWGARVQEGLSSGEGLIYAVRDPVGGKEGDPEAPPTDPGVSDKRLMVTESEYASVLRLAARDGNTLSATMRRAWDTGRLHVLNKNSPCQATGAHISIVGHITRDELLRHLEGTETANGFANRFLWLAVKRSQCLPEGGDWQKVDTAGLVARLRQALGKARLVGQMRRDEEARAIWRAVYPSLSAGRPGLMGAVTSRAEAQVLRLSLVYALLDGSPTVNADHLRAALAVWEYCEASARWVFGDKLGDPDADAILKALRQSEGGLTRWEISNLFGRNKSAAGIARALALLAEVGAASRTTLPAEKPGGRPAELWQAI